MGAGAGPLADVRGGRRGLIISSRASAPYAVVRGRSRVEVWIFLRIWDLSVPGHPLRLHLNEPFSNNSSGMQYAAKATLQIRIRIGFAPKSREEHENRTAHNVGRKDFPGAWFALRSGGNHVGLWMPCCPDGCASLGRRAQVWKA